MSVEVKTSCFDGVFFFGAPDEPGTNDDEPELFIYKKDTNDNYIKHFITLAEFSAKAKERRASSALT